MKTLKNSLFVIAIFQAVSTLIGFVELLLKPEWFAPVLSGTAFANHTIIAAVLLGICVGGFQWTAVIIHCTRPQWLPLAHTLAGLIMVGWIAGECLVINSFTWPHALWGGIAILQLTLVLRLLGVHHPFEKTANTPV